LTRHDDRRWWRDPSHPLLSFLADEDDQSADFSHGQVLLLIADLLAVLSVIAGIVVAIF
jgi:hypothetical protein